MSDTAGILGPSPEGQPTQQAAPSYPTLAQQGANFGQAVARWVGGGAPTRTAEEITELVAICRACPSGEYDANQERCMACGCPVRAAGAWRNKLAMRTERCPRGHW